MSANGAQTAAAHDSNARRCHKLVTTRCESPGVGGDGPRRFCWSNGFESHCQTMKFNQCPTGGHSDKECVAEAFKGDYGHRRLTVWCDNTRELLTIIARPGNHSSNAVTDHSAVMRPRFAMEPCWTWLLPDGPPAETEPPTRRLRSRPHTIDADERRTTTGHRSLTDTALHRQLRPRRTSVP